MDKNKKKEDLPCVCTGTATGIMSGKTARKNGKWVKPELKDVSGQVMAQPYIRFT